MKKALKTFYIIPILAFFLIYPSLISATEETLSNEVSTDNIDAEIPPLTEEASIESADEDQQKKDAADGVIELQDTKDISLIIGELTTIKTKVVTRVSVTDPNIADIAETTEDQIILIGKSIGQTSLFVWDEDGKHTINILVTNQDLNLVKERLESLFQITGINKIAVKVSSKEQKVVVSGDVSEEQKTQFGKIVGMFFDDVIDLVEDEKIDDLIQIDMQITELNTTLDKTLGISWGTQTTSTGTSSGSGTGSTGNSNSTGIILPYSEDKVTFDGSIGDFFKIGDFKRVAFLQATVHALLTEGRARVLSEPKLVVVSGEEAKFLVGGEIPIRTTTSSTGGGSVQENVTFKEYGVGMSIIPKIRKGKIDIDLNVEISDIDSSKPSGNDIAFVTRTASTKLYLNDGQPIILAGLIRRNDGDVMRKVPVLGKIPVIGLLFQHRTKPVPDTDQEVVISLTPHIIPSHLQTAQNENMPKAAQKIVNEIKDTGKEEKVEEIKSASPTQDQASKEENKQISETKVELKQQEQPQQEAALPKEEINIPPPIQTSAGVFYSGVPQEMTEYVRAVQEKIARGITYPKEAEELGWEGKVKIVLLIFSDGKLGSVSVKESSGHELFDQDVIDAAKRVAPYSPFPSTTNLRELNVTIPVVYTLK